MITGAVLHRIEARLARALAPPTDELTPLVVGSTVAGRLTAGRATRLAAFADVFRRDGAALTFAPYLSDAAQRSEAIARVTRQLAAEGALTAWRDERYAVAPAFGASPWFVIERAAARYFGVHTYGAHVNGLVRMESEVLMWLARRSATKAIDPGMLDNLVGGGVAADAQVHATVVKEAWEEAGIAAPLASTAKLMGTVEVFREQPDGIQHETIHVHDLWLPPAFVPVSQDREVAEFRRVSLREAAEIVALGAGPDMVTAEASLVAFDCLTRLYRKPSTMPPT
ncbi:MAG: DUF4743 domain-containing protein [Burkholderiales bacterium]|nr:DUF4743 domain-containing protein [Burkholderiales bacterium]